MINKFSHFLGISILFISTAIASQEQLERDNTAAISRKTDLLKEKDRLLEENAVINKKLQAIGVEYDQLANETNQLVRDNEDLQRQLAQASIKLAKLKKQNSIN